MRSINTLSAFNETPGENYWLVSAAGPRLPPHRHRLELNWVSAGQQWGDTRHFVACFLFTIITSSIELCLLQAMYMIVCYICIDYYWFLVSDDESVEMIHPRESCRCRSQVCVWWPPIFHSVVVWSQSGEDVTLPAPHLAWTWDCRTISTQWQYWTHWTEIIVIMKLSLTLCLALASTVSGFLIKISEKLSTADCQDVLNNLEVCIQDVKSLLQNWFLLHCNYANFSLFTTWSWLVAQIIDSPPQAEFWAFVLKKTSKRAHNFSRHAYSSSA